MIDITPELLERIKGQFNREYDKSSSIKGVLSKIEKGNATYEDANEYAREIGEILSGALTDNLSSSVLPDGKMYYNIANEIFNDVLGNNYELATNVSASVQQVLNEKSGIGLNAIRPNVDQKRIDGIIDKVSNEDTFDKIKWIVGEPVVNYTQSAVDETIKQNSEFQYKAGLRPKIVRKLGGKCCDWCAKLVGEYSYPDVPKDVYRRHENCRCTVEYINGTKRQNVHTKSYIEENKKEVKERINRITEKPKANPIDEVNKDMEQTLSEIYESHRKRNKLKLVPFDESLVKNQVINANFGNINVDVAKEFTDTISGLSSKYDSSLQKVRIMTKNEFLELRNTFASVGHEYSVDSSSMILNPAKMKDAKKLSERISELIENGYCVDIGKENALKYVPTHEFAHTLINIKDSLPNTMNWAGADFNKIRSARKEISDVYEKYIDAIEPIEKKAKELELDYIVNLSEESAKKSIELYDELKQIKISDYSMIDADEFMAESFTLEIFGKGNEFTHQIMEIIRKYFGK